MHTYAASYGAEYILDPTWQEAIRKSAMKQIEYSMGTLPEPEVTRQAAAKLSDMQRKNEVETASLHLPFYPFDQWAYTSEDNGVRKKTIQKTLEYMRHFESLEIRQITIHCGGEPNLPNERRRKMESMRRTCEDLLPLLEQWDASLNLELLPRSCIGNSFDDLEYILAGFPERHFGICFDVNHLLGEAETVPDKIRKYGSRIRSFHISDYDNIDECHWHVGEGALNWPEIIQAIRRLPHDVLLILETGKLHAPQNGRRIDSKYVVQSSENDAMHMEFASELETFHERMNRFSYANMK